MPIDCGPFNTGISRPVVYDYDGVNKTREGREHVADHVLFVEDRYYDADSVSSIHADMNTERLILAPNWISLWFNSKTIANSSS